VFYSRSAEISSQGDQRYKDNYINSMARKRDGIHGVVSLRQ
jgi:hypothetical protein